MTEKILIVDDESSIRESLAGILADEGFETLAVESAEEIFSVLEEEQISLVLLDIWMPGMDGMEALKRIKEQFPSMPVIMISGHGNIETAVQATKMGAFDFIEKPLSYDRVVLGVKNGLHIARLERDNVILKQKDQPKPDFSGESEAIKSVRRHIERVAPTDAWVLIRGEHGTGKELAAHMIHRLSPYSHKAMVEVNCAAIPDELIESELFGHEKGAFTGATSSRRGKFDQADGGILFLDEIGDMSLKAQAKILRILEEHKFERVGGSKTIRVNVRVLAATNKDLEEEINQGNFRADLFWRLNVVPIRLPSLRERLEDIPMLVESLMSDYAKKGYGERVFSEEALQVMARHDWPGNVRELRNFLERISIMTSENVVTAEQVELFLTSSRLGSGITARENEKINFEEKAEHGLSEVPGDITFKEAKNLFEKKFLQDRLSENEGNISQTAEQIGLERSHLHKKLKRLKLTS
ncbi:MAG: sigma-54-dependent transcriptional regulator [Desulfurivibrionaceae bacterium]